MLAQFTSRTSVFWLVSGLLCALAFQTSWSWLLYVPALWLFLVAWERTTQTKQIFYGTLVMATCKAAGATVWFWSVYPVDWLPIAPGAGQLTLICMYWVLNALTLGVGAALVFTLWKWLQGTRTPVLLLALVWPLAEIAGSVMYSVVTLGPGSTINAQFSFGYIGYLLADLSIFDPVAAIGGVYLLSVVAVGCVIVLYHATRRRSPLALGALVCFMLLLVGVTTLTQGDTTDSQLPHIVSIDTAFTTPYHIALDEQESRHRVLSEEIASALRTTPDIVVLPEGSSFSLGFPSTIAALAWLSERATTSPVVLIDSAVVPETDDHLVVRAIIYDTGAQTVHFIDKQSLVPQGEYVPYLFRGFIRLLLEPAAAEALLTRVNNEPGMHQSYEFVSERVPPILFCFESVDPRGIQTLLTKRDSAVVVHPLSHAWFHEPDMFWLALERMLSVQAIWNDVTIIEASNMKTSAVYTPNR